jgi:2-oxoglutarate ferredoxin oxidoreductase subunit beta
LKKLERDYDPTDRLQAMQILDEARRRSVLLTGLIYISKEQPPLQEVENLVDTPLTMLPAEKLRPSSASLDELNRMFT